RVPPRGPLPPCPGHWPCFSSLLLRSAPLALGVLGTAARLGSGRTGLRCRGGFVAGRGVLLQRHLTGLVDRGIEGIGRGGRALLLGLVGASTRLRCVLVPAGQSRSLLLPFLLVDTAEDEVLLFVGPDVVADPVDDDGDRQERTTDEHTERE